MKEQIEKLAEIIKSDSAGFVYLTERARVEIAKKILQAGYRLIEGDEDGLLRREWIASRIDMLVLQGKSWREIGEYVAKAQQALTQRKTAEEIFAEIEDTLSMAEDFSGFITISNHVPIEAWQSLKSRYLPTQSDKGEK